MTDVPEDAELSAAEGIILWRPPSRPLNGAWWNTDIPDPSPETTAAIRRIAAELAQDGAA